jgi:hypothetical protein
MKYERWYSGARKRSAARQWHRKHVKAVKTNHATTDELLDTVFSTRPVLRIYKEKQLEFSVRGVGVERSRGLVTEQRLVQTVTRPTASTIVI